MLINTFAKSSRHSRIALSITIIAVISIAAYKRILVPHTQYLHASQQYASVMDNMAKKNQLIRSRQVIKEKEVEKLRTQLTDAQASLFTAVEAKRFFSDIETICNETGCDVTSINFLSSNLGELSAFGDNGKAVVENSAVVSFIGSYSNIIKFIARIENRPQKVLIHSLKMFTSDGKSDPLECEVMTTIYTISEKEVFTNE